ncbi:hypothetical protein BGW80DRAFT_169147 [Lactifluus volemus]|nr:hypothetical protein BGW80DRAFT_169147 [Lactifluus volemus]
MRNHAWVPLNLCSSSSPLRQRAWNHPFPFVARALSHHLYRTLFYHAHRPRLRGALFKRFPPLSIARLSTGPLLRHRELHLGAPTRLLPHYLHLHHSQRKMTMRAQSYRGSILYLVLVHITTDDSELDGHTRVQSHELEEDCDRTGLCEAVPAAFLEALTFKGPTDERLIGFIKAFSNKCKNSGMGVGNEPLAILPTAVLLHVKDPQDADA